MAHDPRHILSILDACCDAYTFPMLDNGYLYPAASRLSLYRSTADWALVIEVFGFSPRTGSPDVHVYAFASRLHARDPRERYVSQDAYERYLANNPNNESRFFFPIDDDSWQDPDNCEFVAHAASALSLRGNRVSFPPTGDYCRHGIAIEEPPRIRVFELCRYLAATQRDLVLATVDERRASVLPEMPQLMQLEEWRHPNLLEEERPSTSQAFQQLAEVLASGDSAFYRPSEEPNTHWRNWPEGGCL